MDRPLYGELIDDAEPAPEEALEWGDHDLAADRELLIRAMLRDSRDLRAVILRREQELLDRIERMPIPEEPSEDESDAAGIRARRKRARGFTVDGTRLAYDGRRTMLEMIPRRLGALFTELNQTIEEGLRVTLQRSRRQTLQRLRDMGLDLGDDPVGQAKLLEQRVFGLLDKEFPPGSGMTYRRRMERLQEMHIRQLQGVVSASYAQGQAPAMIARQIDRAMGYYRPGTRIKGGSLYKQSRRMLIAEESRLATAMELEILRLGGVQFVYWRLSSFHPWYGGKEICEVFASRVSEETSARLRSVGQDPNEVELAGLYPIDRYPEYPHPFCKCFPEPFIHAELQSTAMPPVTKRTAPKPAEDPDVDQQDDEEEW